MHVQFERRVSAFPFVSIRGDANTPSIKYTVRSVFVYVYAYISGPKYARVVSGNANVEQSRCRPRGYLENQVDCKPRSVSVTRGGRAGLGLGLGLG